MITDNQTLEKRIAAIERQLEDGKKELKFAIDSWTTVLLKFIDDFAISSPELDELVTKLKQKPERKYQK